MSVVFGDSSFWIARRDERDANNPAALALTAELLKRRASFVVTPLVFAEVHAYFSRSRIKRERVMKDLWNNPVIRMEQPSLADQQEAVEILRANEDKTFSFCDAVSFALMERMEIETAISFDHHFKQFGRFAVLDGSNL